MLLRHSNTQIKRLRKYGASIEEYTALQPKGSRYDFWDKNRSEKIRFVALIVDDRVHGVFKIVGQTRDGTALSLCTTEFRRFDEGNPNRECWLYELERVPSLVEGRLISRWHAPLHPTAVQGESLFTEITVGVEQTLELLDAVEAQFRARVQASVQTNAEERDARLQNAVKRPAKRQVISYVFERNPDVVAAVLFRAQGKCERCKQHAPFMRKSDLSPYLEVHHIKQLANDGEDTVENAQAVCPNCHRRAHFGQD